MGRGKGSGGGGREGGREMGETEEGGREERERDRERERVSGKDKGGKMAREWIGYITIIYYNCLDIKRYM